MSLLAHSDQNGFIERQITMADGLRLYLRDYGDPLSKRSTVVCLTGLTRNSRDYHDLATELSAHHRVICPDYIGRGLSDRADKSARYEPRNMLGDILAMTTALNLHDCVFIGTSLGGFLTMGLAVISPTLLKAAVLNDVGPDFGAEALDRIIDYVSWDHPSPDWDTAMRELITTFPQLGFEEERDWRSLAEGSFRAGPDNQLHIDWDPAIAETLGQDEHGFDLWALFRALKPRPVLAFRGANSDALAPETFARMVEIMPEMTAVTVENRAHTPTLREPIARSAIVTFLDQVDGY